MDNTKTILNEQLYDECIKEVVDFDKVESLLVQGADPLGIIHMDELVYSEVIYSRCFDDNEDQTLEQITRLFLDHGMVIKHLDDDTIVNPFWNIPYLSPPKAISILKILLNESTDIDSLNELVDHCSIDSSMINSPMEDVAGWTRILLYVASYDYLLQRDAYLRTVIDYDSNQYDLRRFKNPFQFYIQFDTSEAHNEYNHQGVVVEIYEKETHNLVWKIHL